jgi:hypothetical protein
VRSPASGLPMTAGEPMADRTTPTEGPLRHEMKMAHWHSDPAEQED